MLPRNLGSLLLQQCMAPQLWMQQCSWMGAAGLSTSAGSRAAEAASAEVQQADAGVGVNSSSDSSASRSRRTPLAPGHQYLKLTFDKLHDDVQQSLDFMNPQSEIKLRVLMTKAKTKEQIQATVSALRYNYMRRCRLQQFKPFGPEVLRELWQAGRKVGLRSSFAVQLLEQANSLGVKTSLGLCEEVLRACIRRKDYLAASRAWLYTKAYCSTTGARDAKAYRRTTGQLLFVSTGTAAKITAAGAVKRTAMPRVAGWASKNIIRVYLSGMIELLKQGGLGYKHQQRLRQEVQQLAKELGAAGVDVAWVHKGLQEAAKSSRSKAKEASEGTPGGDQPGDGADKPAA